MKIKTKLGLNLATFIVMIAAVSVASIMGMWFIKGKLFYLTEHSTPFQVRTLDFQRAVQSATADLVKVGFAAAMQDYKTGRLEAEKSLEEVRSLEDSLKALLGGAELHTHKELNDTAAQLFMITEGRIQSVSDATAAGTELSQKLAGAVKQLKDLDSKIKTMQSSKNSTFSTSFEKTKNITGSVRGIESLGTSLKDLQIASGDMFRATGRKQVIIAKGKATTALNRIQQNEYLKNTKAITTEDIQKLSIRIEEVQKAQIALFEQGSEANKNLFDVSVRDLSERISAAILATEQETGLVSEAYSIEVNRQGTAYSQSNTANAILTLNAELLAQGLAVEGLAARLFSLDSQEALDATGNQLRNSFSRIDVVEKNLSRLLKTADARGEAKTLQSVIGSLRSIQASVLAETGIISKLRQSIAMGEKSRVSMQKLREIVLKQSQKGRETITTASGEQAKAIASVNKLVRVSISGIAVLGISAAVFGLVFGVWVYRSISRPLEQLVKITDQVATGDLRGTMETAAKDEIGIVQASVGKMVTNLHRIVASISKSTHLLASSSHQLSGAAVSLEQGSQNQTIQVEQVAAAVTEMTQTNQDVALNSAKTSDTAGIMRRTAEHGRKTMDETVEQLNIFAESVQETATRIEALGQRSKDISDVVRLIEDVADQTNLLALNAAIEAARAGEQGRGFTIVADNVRQLAHRTTDATAEIGKTVRSMQDEVKDSVKLITEERESVEKLVEKVRTALSEIDLIAEYVEQVAGMVAQVAVATEEQSAVCSDVSRNMEGISGVTKELSGSLADIKRASGDLSNLADELSLTAEWFKV